MRRAGWLPRALLLVAIAAGVAAVCSTGRSGTLGSTIGFERRFDPVQLTSKTDFLRFVLADEPTCRTEAKRVDQPMR